MSPQPGSLRLEHRFELDFDADLPGDHEPAAIQGQVPGEAPVFLVYDTGGSEDGPVAAPWVGPVAEVLGVQGDLSDRVGDAVLSAG